MSCLEELVGGAAGHHHNGAHAAGPACSGLASLVCWCCSSLEVRVFLWYACLFIWLKRCKPLEDEALSPAAVLTLLSNSMHRCPSAASCQVSLGAAEQVGASVRTYCSRLGSANGQVEHACLAPAFHMHVLSLKKALTQAPHPPLPACRWLLWCARCLWRSSPSASLCRARACWTPWRCTCWTSPTLSSLARSCSCPSRWVGAALLKSGSPGVAVLHRQAAALWLPVTLPLLPRQQTASQEQGRLLLHCWVFPPAPLPLNCKRRHLAPPAAANFVEFSPKTPKHTWPAFACMSLPCLNIKRFAMLKAAFLTCKRSTACSADRSQCSIEDWPLE